MGTPKRCDARLNSTLIAEQQAAGGEQECGGFGLVRGHEARLAMGYGLWLPDGSHHDGALR